MLKKWASHPDFPAPHVKEVACEPAPDQDTHGRAWYIPEIDRYVVWGVHLFDTEEEARTAHGAEWTH